MEEHGSTLALLRHREQETEELATRDAATQETVKKLTAEVRTLKDRATRSEHKVTLAEREASFLQAMLVSISVIRLYDVVLRGALGELQRGAGNSGRCQEGERCAEAGA